MPAKSINLLPKGSGGNKALTKGLRIAWKISYFSIFVFVAVIVLGFGSQFFFSQSLSNIKSQQESLKSNIVSLEETEYRLILTKDRVQKIEQVLSQRTIEEIYGRQKVLTDNLPATVTLASLSIDSEKSVIELTALNSRDLVRFMATLVVLPDINVIAMDSLKFNPVTGYTIILEIT